MDGGIGRWAAVTFACALAPMAACRGGGTAVRPEPADAAASRVPGGPSVALDPAALFAAHPAATVRARTTVTIQRSGVPVTLRDERELRRTPGGDLELTVRRLHAGSEAGDTEEAFQAAKVGRDWFTRGSGGPWVRWDDPGEEPGEAVRSVFEGTRELLDLARACGRLPETGTRRDVTPGVDPCPAAAPVTGAPWRAQVRSVSGRTDWDGDRLSGMVLDVKMRLSAGGNDADVVIAHQFETGDRPADARVPAPADVVDSRRERPVRMVESVLAGLVDRWGPGAPPSAVRPAAKEAR